MASIVSITNTNDYFIQVIKDGNTFDIKKDTVTTYSDEPYLYLRWSEYNSLPLRQNEFKVDFNNLTVGGAGVASAAAAETAVDAYLYTPNLTVDGTLATNSDLKYPSEKAVRTYVASAISSMTLASGKIFVGSAGNVATAQTLTLSASGGAFALGSTGILTMPNADGSARGLLLAADWTTFNGKQSALGDDFAIGDTNGSSENLQVIVNNTNDYMVVGDNTVGSELGIFYYGASSSGASFTETGIIIDVFNNTYSIGNLAFDFILVQQGVVTGLANSSNVTIATPSLFFVLDESTLRFTFQAGGIVNMSLTNYASDAAAGAAGLTTGDLYRTAGAVMVKL